MLNLLFVYMTANITISLISTKYFLQKIILIVIFFVFYYSYRLFWLSLQR